MFDEMNRIHLCKYCGRPEYWGKFIWLSGKMCCRDCYKEEYEKETGKKYTWNDLDGHRPTMEEMEKQHGNGNERND